ncbi:MAG: c-type cytochrome biogenesis protein CcmI [Vitreoscilla sp.]|nr:c-type cytochrome biogenesis protein CcmI [Polaromonas sp.]
MIAFWISAALLLVLALALVLPALLKSKNNTGKATDGAAQANLSVLRSQLTQLDAEFVAGSINADQLAFAKSEIERRALEEESASEVTLGIRPAKSSRTAIVVGLAIPLLALGIYGFLGNINALDPANLQAKADAEPTPEQIEAMVSAFAARLEAVPASQPSDPKAWEMLARSYAAMQKFPEANKAYKRAVELNPGNAQILADHADVLAMLQSQSMLGEPTKLFERALVLDPNNLKALALAGSAAFEKKDFATAVQFWSKAQGLAPPGSDFAKGLASSVEEARAASGQTAPPQVVAKSAPTPTAAASSIQGIVSLSPASNSKVAPDDTVFIFARAVQGPRMPLAILKRKASELPITFTLDDSTAMADELKLSKFELVIVGARVSKSGNALPQSGDLVGQSKPVKAGGSKLTLVIDRVQP